MSRLFFAALLAAAAWGADGDFNGRWNITVHNESRVRVWWLEVTSAGGADLKGRFVGAPGGDMDRIPQISLKDGELTWIFERVYNRAKGAARERGVYRARLERDRLKGSFQVEGRPDTRMEFTGVRAPKIADRPDARWREGKPVELFNGVDLTGWECRVPNRPLEWRVEDGLLKNKPGAADLTSTGKFWNFKLHVEYRVGPKSNSGIGLRGRYEVQILEDYGRPPDTHGNGALYSRILPATNASKPANEWQTFDITLIGRYVTVVLNGVTIIDKQEIEGFTAMATDPNEDQPGPITLQGDHGPVDFRKITLTPLTR